MLEAIAAFIGGILLVYALAFVWHCVSWAVGALLFWPIDLAKGINWASRKTDAIKQEIYNGR